MFDGLDGGKFFAAHKRESVADVLGAAGASDAVDVIFRMLRDVVIDHVAHAGDIESARGYVGRYHHFVFAALESVERFDPFPLCAIGM